MLAENNGERWTEGKIPAEKGNHSEAKFFVLDNTLLLIPPAKGRNGCLGTNSKVRQ